MLMLYLFVALGYSKLTAYDTQSKSLKLLSYTVLPFGDPALYSVSGQAVFRTASSDYTDLKDMFAIISVLDKDSLVELALLAQNAGAIGVIFQTDSSSFKYNANKAELMKEITIPCIIIKNSYLETSQEHLWISYKYDLIVAKMPLITLTITGDYTSDKPFLEALFNLHKKIKLLKTDLTIQTAVANDDDEFIDPVTDCLVYNSNSICMASTTNATGKQRLANSIYLSSLLDYSSDLTTFFTSILSFYEKCEFDYSLDCIEANFKAIPLEIRDDFIQGTKISSVQINSRYIFWPSYIEAAFCLSSMSPPEACTRCSEHCAFADLLNESCDEGCNIAACGFDNLKCVDKKRDDDICTPGCLYSVMEKGSCPAECTGSCFEHCDSKKYCSPGCTYGIDSENCIPDYHTKRILYCSSSCKDEYDNNGYCPRDCTQDCCNGDKSSSSGTSTTIVIAISVPISACCCW